MPITFLQSKTGIHGGSPTSQAMAFTNPQLAGNMIIVVAAFIGTNTITQTVSDTAGNLYQVAVVQRPFSNMRMGIFYAYPCNAANANTVTVAFSSAVTDSECAIHEYAGFGNVPVQIDTTYSVGQLSDTATPTSTLVTATANDFMFAASMNTNQFNSGDGNWNTRVLDNSLGGLITADRLATAAGTYTFVPNGNAGVDTLKQAVAFILPIIGPQRSYQGQLIPVV